MNDEYEIRHVDAPPEQFETLKKWDANVEKSWNHNRVDLETQDILTYDEELAYYALRAEWDIQAVVDLICAHHAKYNVSERYNDLHTVDNVLNRSKRRLKASQTQRKSNNTPQFFSSSDKETVLDEFGDLIGANIDDIVLFKQFEGNRSRVQLRLSDDIYWLGDIAKLENQDMFRKRIMEITETVPLASDGKPFDDDTWYQLVQELLDAMSVREIDYNRFDNHRFQKYLQQYLNAHFWQHRAKNPLFHKEWKKRADNKRPFERDGEVFFSKTHFMEFVKEQFDSKMGRHLLNAYFNENGFTKQRIKVDDSDYYFDYKFWKVPDFMLDKDRLGEHYPISQ